MTEFERAAKLQRPLPSWWLRGQGRDLTVPESEGLGFIIERSGRRFRCLVPIAVLQRFSGNKSSPASLWRRHAEDFVSAGKRALMQRGFRVKGPLRLALSDLIVDE
jgi:hypothetical protein